MRILAGDYLGITEPNALLRLLDLEERTKEAETPGTFQARIFVSEGTSFHPKACLFYGPTEIAYVGSSNLSRSALEQAIERNYYVVFDAGFESVARAFDRLFRDPRTRHLHAAWIEAYRERRPARVVPPIDVGPERQRKVPEPHKIPQKALEALAKNRAEGNAAGLVVLSAGHR